MTVGDAQSSLRGKQVVVTRPLEETDRLVETLLEHGAEVVRFPVIRIVPASDQELAKAVSKIKKYDVIGLTSPNGAHHFLEAIGSKEDAAGLLANKLVGAVGPATAAVLENAGVAVSLVSQKGLASA